MIELHRWRKLTSPYQVLDGRSWTLDPGKSLAKHQHKFYEIFLLQSGKVLHQLDEKDELIEAGDCFFISPTCVHGFSNTGSEVCQWINLRINPAAQDKLRELYETDLGGWPWEAGKATKFHLNPELMKSFTILFDHAPTTPNRDMDLICLLAPIFLNLTFDAPSFDLPKWLSRALQLYQTYQGKDLHLTTFVSDCQRSRDHVARVVREYFGMSTSAWLREKRLERAAHELHFSSLSIPEIAQNCGFENISGFYRHFKNQFGVSPGVFRGQLA